MFQEEPDTGTPTGCVVAAVVSDIGAVRERNEDAAFLPGVIIGGAPRTAYSGTVTPGPGGMVGVLDGLGGHAAGSTASLMAAAVLSDLATSAAGEWAELDVEPGEGWLEWAVQMCAHRITAIGDLEDATQLMGTTVAGLLLGQHAVDVFHVGDSRVYLSDGDELVLLTRDHRSEVGGKLTQALGGTGTYDAVEPGIVTIDRRRPVRYILCSDGLSDTIDFAAIRALVAGGTAEATAMRLVRDAVNALSQDNVTVMVVDVPATSEGS